MHVPPQRRWYRRIDYERDGRCSDGGYAIDPCICSCDAIRSVDADGCCGTNGAICTIRSGDAIGTGGTEFPSGTTASCDGC